MLDRLDTKPSYDHRVTSIKHVVPIHPDSHDFMEVTVRGKEPECFSHVVSTTSFAALRTIDMDQVRMTYNQRTAIRTLGYGSAVKVGIKFKTRWWEQGTIKQLGGSSYTDRQSRVVVYPSYGLGEEGPGVLMVTYNWCVELSDPSLLSYA